MAKRVMRIIKDMEPTHVMVFGDWAMKALLPNVEFLEKKRGWTLDLDAHGYECKISGHLDIQPLYSTHQEDADSADEDEGESAEHGSTSGVTAARRPRG
jgi:hypothetical protein